jgi:hypothetical protein
LFHFQLSTNIFNKSQIQKINEEKYYFINHVNLGIAFGGLLGNSSLNGEPDD